MVLGVEVPPKYNFMSGPVYVLLADIIDGDGILVVFLFGVVWLDYLVDDGEEVAEHLGMFRWVFL